MISIILTGAPGSGKGTQSEFIVKKYGFEHLSTGDLLRKEIAAGTELGQMVDALIAKGNLVPDDIILDIIANYIDALPADTKGIIFDGFPRTVNQAIELEKLLAKKGLGAKVIELVVAEEELISRLLKRGQTSGRADDNLESIQHRLEVFHAQTKPVCDYYASLGKHRAVQGVGTMEAIFADICRAIED